MTSIRQTVSSTFVVGSAAVVLGIFSQVSLAQSYTDNFDDGDDAGWTRYQPLAPFGAGGTYTFPSGGYRIQAPPSPNVGVLGVSRVGAIAPVSANTDVNFDLSVDLLSLGGSPDQSYGLAFNGREAGLGTTDGYIFYFLTDSTRTIGRAIFNRIDNELGTPLGTAVTFPMTPDMQFHLRVVGTGSSFRGEIYDVAEPNTLLGFTEITDSTYGSGQTGLFVTGRTIPDVLNPPLDATFDNFRIIPAPGSVVLLGLAGLLARRRRR